MSGLNETKPLVITAYNEQPSGPHEIGPVVITAYKEQTYGMGGGGGYSDKYSMQAQQDKWTSLLGMDPENAPGGARWVGMARSILGKQETAVRNDYIEAQKNLDNNLKKEIEEVKEANPFVGKTEVKKIAHELSLYNNLVEKKTSFLQEQIVISHAFYRGDPIGRNPNDFVSAMYRLRREGKPDSDISLERYKSLTAAYTAKLVESVIASLKAQADTFNRSLAEATSKASNDLRVANEQARLKQYPAAPPGVSIDGNLEIAKKKDQFFPTSGSAHIYTWFYTQVRNKGDWDYKQRGPEYQNFGNFNYGATGTAAGIPEGVLLRAAGAAQTVAGTSSAEFGKWWSEAPYGDDPIDQVWIKAGIDYAKSKGY